MNTDGIYEKLKRADENIRNLSAEVATFIQKCDYPVMPKIDSQEHGKAVAYFQQLGIPLRFSVLAGEIIHHLRSCLDHIIWELSDDATRNSKAGQSLEFPVLKARPASKDEIARYERKIKGVTHVGVLKFIDELQPYNRTHPHIDMLWIIHHMDIFDKHRELVVTHSTGYMEGPFNLMREMRRHLTRKIPISAALKREFDKHGKITPQVSFRNLPGWEAQPIVPVLTELTNHVRYVVIQFRRIVI